jgi:flagellar basal-body rod protein FlgF
MYVAMSGAMARLDQLDAIADNLANSQTPGFKAVRPTYESFTADEPERTGPSTQVHTALVSNGVDLRPGQVSTTNRPLDVVPENNAFFAVQGLNGGVAFTRNGNMQVSALGQLLTAGQAVLGTSGETIHVPPGTIPTIAEDGTVTAGGSTVGKLALFQLEGPVERMGGAIVTPADGGAARSVDAKVHVGQLEMSNSNPLQLTVDLISAQRQYDTSMQAIQAYKTLDGQAMQVGHVS